MFNVIRIHMKKEEFTISFQLAEKKLKKIKIEKKTTRVIY